MALFVQSAPLRWGNGAPMEDIMRTAGNRMGGIAVVVAACGLGSVMGCGEVNDPGSDTDVGQVQAEFRRHHRQPPMGTHGTGGSTVPGGTATGGASGRDVTNDCAVCDRAANCCNAVTSGPLCDVSASACESVAPASRAPYVNACLTLLNAVIGANLAAPPAACGQ
jgi:hypothetical protein